MSGGSINTLGGSIDTSEIDAATLVVESETITSNDNDTTIPTSAAVKNYADAETGTLTNKTFDTAGAGNSFSINSTAISAVTGTGSAVLATSPTLTTPDIGTPSAAVLTNATGTAASLTAGNVTTNANLTGDVTSIGNATTTVTNANLTGGVTSVGNAATVITNANLTGEVTSTGNAALLNVTAISGQATVTAVAGDMMLIEDATDGLLKQADVNDLLGGGGGLAGTSVKTIGTSGDYSDVAAAIAGETTPYHFVLVSDVTEDSDVAADGVLVIDLDRYTLTMGANGFTTAAAVDFTVIGKGPESGAEIDWTYTAGAKRLFGDTGTSFINIEGIKLDNNSTQTNCYISAGTEMIRNVKFEVPNVATGGFRVLKDGATYDNLHIVGGGTASEGAIHGNSNLAVTFNNITFSGVFKSSTVAASVFDIGDDWTVNNVNFYHGTNPVHMTIENATVSNVTVSGGQDLDITIDGAATAAKLTNVDLLAGDIDLVATDGGSFSNVHTTGLIDVSDAGCTNNKFVNCRATTALVVAGDRNKFSNCDFIGGATANSGADDNGFVNSQFGVDGGGGALTLTINSTSNRTRVLGCMADAAIVDNGTSSELFGNTTY